MKRFLLCLAMVTIAVVLILCGGCKTVDTGDLLNANEQVIAATDNVEQSSDDISTAIDEVVIATKDDPEITATVTRLVAARDRLAIDVAKLKEAVNNSEEEGKQLAQALTISREKCESLSELLKKARAQLAAVLFFVTLAAVAFGILKWVRII